VLQENISLTEQGLSQHWMNKLDHASKQSLTHPLSKYGSGQSLANEQLPQPQKMQEVNKKVQLCEFYEGSLNTLTLIAIESVTEYSLTSESFVPAASSAYNQLTLAAAWSSVSV
jgi:hypothetical protein